MKIRLLAIMAIIVLIFTACTAPMPTGPAPTKQSPTPRSTAPLSFTQSSSQGFNCKSGFDARDVRMYCLKDFTATADKGPYDDATLTVYPGTLPVYVTVGNRSTVRIILQREFTLKPGVTLSATVQEP